MPFANEKLDDMTSGGMNALATSHCKGLIVGIILQEYVTAVNWTWTFSYYVKIFGNIIIRNHY